jgi:hypothetical protein
MVWIFTTAMEASRSPNLVPVQSISYGRTIFGTVQAFACNCAQEFPFIGRGGEGGLYEGVDADLQDVDWLVWAGARTQWQRGRAHVPIEG